MLSTTLASVVEQVGGENPAIGDILQTLAAEGDLEQATVVVFFIMVGLLAACAAVQIVARARQEEAHGTAEPVLATPVQRVRWLADFVAIGFIAIVVTCAAGFAGAAIGAAGSESAADLRWAAVVTASGQLAAASVFLVLTALVFTIAPRCDDHRWAGRSSPSASLFGLFGPLFGFPEWMVDLSPFTAAPAPDGDSVDFRGLWWLLLVVAGGAAASLTLMRRRELARAGDRDRGRRAPGHRAGRAGGGDADRGGHGPHARARHDGPRRLARRGLHGRRAGRAPRRLGGGGVGRRALPHVDAAHPPRLAPRRPPRPLRPHRTTPGTGMMTANAPLYANLAGFMDQIADENADAPLSVERAREVADFLRYLAARMPELVDEWRAQRETGGEPPSG